MNVWRATYKYSLRASVGGEPQTGSGLFLTAPDNRTLYDVEKAIAAGLGPLFHFPALLSVEWLGLSANLP